MRPWLIASVELILLTGASWQACAAPAAPAAQPIHLPLTFIKSNPVTTITVGGRAVQAIVDTGGTVDGALKLSKEVIEGAGGVGLEGAAVTSDASGREFTSPRFRVPAVIIDGHTFHDLTVVEAPARKGGDAPPIPNAIGRQFLARYFVVVDYAGRSVTLWRPGSKRPAGLHCGRTRIPMEATKEAGLAVSEFDTQSGRLRLLWDTGATYSALPDSLAAKLQLATTLNLKTKFWNAQAFSAAGHDFGPVEFVLLPLKLPADFEGLIGRNFFQSHVVCLDYARREVRVRDDLAGTFGRR